VGLVIEALCGEDTRLESDHLRLLEHVGSCIGLRVDLCRIDRLAFEGRLAPVPHDRGEKVEIGRGKRPPVHRHDPGCRARQPGGWLGRAIIGIVNAGHCELQDRRVRKRQADPDETLACQKLIGFGLGGERRHIVGGTGRAVDQPENWISAAALFEPGLYTGRADGPAGLRLMSAFNAVVVGPPGCKVAIFPLGSPCSSNLGIVGGAVCELALGSLYFRIFCAWPIAPASQARDCLGSLSLKDLCLRHLREAA
jgi:hypothetical protein